MENLKIRNLSIDEVTINDSWWNKVLKQYSTVSLKHIFDMFDYTESFRRFELIANGERKVLDNLSPHAGEILIPEGENKFIGKVSSIFKYGVEPWREALIYETFRGACELIYENKQKGIELKDGEELTKRLVSYVDLIYKAGLTTTDKDYNGKIIDGYFSTHNLLTEGYVYDEAKDAVWDHDLYIFGALIEAGISYFKLTKDDRLLFLATRFAESIIDYIDGRDGFEGYMIVPPHAIAEEALLELYDLYLNNPDLLKQIETKYDGVVNENDRYYHLHIRLEKYLEICHAWVNEKGNAKRRYKGKIYGVYAQDNCDYSEIKEALGHAVRANLFYSSVTAIGNYTNKEEYYQAMKIVWDNIRDTQLYVTGGSGASASLGEAYAGSYVMPQDGYCETCASVGLAYFANNLYKIYGNSEFNDVIELEIYNGVLGCLSLEGNAFYYCNPLVSNDYQRPYWSGATPCCPPMYVKFYAKLPTYIYAINNESLYINQYISSIANYKFNDEDVKVNLLTNLPNENNVKLEINSLANFNIYLRIPSWSNSFTLKVNDKATNNYKIVDNYLIISKEDNIVKIELEFTRKVIRLTQEKVTYNQGQVAIKYGPFVYCAETKDNKVAISDLIISDDVTFNANINNNFSLTQKDGKDTLPVNVLKTSNDITLIPFFIRGNRKPLGEMKVWFYKNAK